MYGLILWEINHNVYLDGEFKRINFETITNDQREIFYKYFKGRKFRSQKVNRVIRINGVKYRDQTMITSLNLTLEEQELIPTTWMQRTNGYDWDSLALTTEHQILVLEYKNGVICGFQEYGEKFSKNGTKYVCHKDDHFDRLIEIEDQPDNGSDNITISQRKRKANSNKASSSETQSKRKRRNTQSRKAKN